MATSSTTRSVMSPSRLSSGSAQGSGSSIDFIQRDLQQFMDAKEQRSSCTIFRVREREKEVKPEHFQHELISLGLYDRSSSDWGTPIPKSKVDSDTPKPNVESDASKSKVDSGTPKLKGDAFRLEIVSALLKQLGKKAANWGDICSKVVENPQKMRDLYEEHGDLLPAAAVRSVLTLDAVFLVCCLGTCYNDEFASTFKPVFKVFMSKSNTFRKMLLLDIIKLENQIPLSLIQNTLQYLIDHKPRQVTRRTGQPRPGMFRGILDKMLEHAGSWSSEDEKQGDVEMTGSPTSQNSLGDRRSRFPAIDKVMRRAGISLPIADKIHDKERGKEGLPRQQSEHVGGSGRSGSGRSEGTNDDDGEEKLDGRRILHSICTGLAVHYRCSLPFTVYSEKYDEKSPIYEKCKHLLDCLYTATFVGSNKEPEEKDNEPTEEDEGSRSPTYRMKNGKELNLRRIHTSRKSRLSMDDTSAVHNEVPLPRLKKEPEEKDNEPTEEDTEPREEDEGSRSHRDRMINNKELKLRSIHTFPKSRLSIDETDEVHNHVLLDGQVALPSATQLHEAGIECRGHSGPFKEPEFKVYTFKATLYLPVITYMKTHSEPLWRNLVAYEDEKCGPNDDAFASYLELMDQLIDTERDVALLRTGKNPVIVAHGLGSEQAVAEVFNSILSNYDVDLKTYHQWNDLRMKICEYYNNKTKQRFAKFAKAYLNEPWLIISVWAASTLLFLTILQTIYSILSYLHRN